MPPTCSGGTVGRQVTRAGVRPLVGGHGGGRSARGDAQHGRSGRPCRAAPTRRGRTPRPPPRAPATCAPMRHARRGRTSIHPSWPSRSSRRRPDGSRSPPGPILITRPSAMSARAALVSDTSIKTAFDNRSYRRTGLPPGSRSSGFGNRIPAARSRATRNADSSMRTSTDALMHPGTLCECRSSRPPGCAYASPQPARHLTSSSG
jgi:hypothetical protein